MHSEKNGSHKVLALTTQAKCFLIKKNMLLLPLSNTDGFYNFTNPPTPLMNVPLFSKPVQLLRVYVCLREKCILAQPLVSLIVPTACRARKSVTHFCGPRVTSNMMGTGCTNEKSTKKRIEKCDFKLGRHFVRLFCFMILDLSVVL